MCVLKFDIRRMYVLGRSKGRRGKEVCPAHGCQVGARRVNAIADVPQEIHKNAPHSSGGNDRISNRGCFSSVPHISHELLTMAHELFMLVFKAK